MGSLRDVKTEGRMFVAKEYKITSARLKELEEELNYL